jgi:hypothetical protein
MTPKNVLKISDQLAEKISARQFVQNTCWLKDSLAVSV